MTTSITTTVTENGLKAIRYKNPTFFQDKGEFVGGICSGSDGNFYAFDMDGNSVYRSWCIEEAKTALAMGVH